MNRLKSNIMLAAMVFAVSAGPSSTVIRADSGRSRTQDLSNDVVDQMSTTIDGKLANREAKIEQNEKEIMAAEIKIKADRIKFEQQTVEESKAFYTYMKSMKPDERKDALNEFNARQQRNRVKFDREQLAAQKQWFNSLIESHWETADIETENPNGFVSVKR